jgi:hypothetical protein
MEPNLLNELHAEAVRRGFLEKDATLDAPTTFTLVRDMPYQRASDRQPETLLREWRGTCSGKHYLLQKLFAELGIRSRLIACTTETRLDPAEAHPRLRPILESGGGRVVDVHNYLLLELQEGEMVVDATWPASYKKYGMTVNEDFILGQDQSIASKPLRIWVVPPEKDAQDFKDEILRENFTDEELAVREDFIRTLGELLAGEGA